MPAQALLQARIVAIALLLSAFLITAVGFALTLGGADPTGENGTATVLFGLWVAAAIGATAGWWILWRGAASLAAGPGTGPAIEAGRLGPESVAGRLIAAYALLEGQMIIALVASFLQRTPMLLVPAFAIMALGILLSFPRREWFARFERT